MTQFAKNTQHHQTKPTKSRVLKTKARKPICVSDGLESESIEANLADATCKLRKQIVKWQDAQNDICLRQLKEHREYKIELKQSTNQTDTITVTIKCTMCDKNIHLGIDEKNGIKLSNWIRHVKQCVQQKKSQSKQQLVLTKYFLSSASGNSSLPKSDSLSDRAIVTDDNSKITNDNALITDDNVSEDSNKQGFQLAPPIVQK